MLLQDIREIIDNCTRQNWNERKDGLVGLNQFLTNGNTLSDMELRKITDIFTKMFMDSHTKVFSLFLDTLNELIVTHNEDLGDWLYVLCARLLNKQGSDLLMSIQAKVHKTLDIVRWVVLFSIIGGTTMADVDFLGRAYFPGDKLLPVVMRFITDPTQTPNSRVKVATAIFLAQVAEDSEPSAFNSSAVSALPRLIDWMSDMKSQDVRRQAQNAVMALYNLNPSQVTIFLSELPKSYQVILHCTFHYERIN